MNRRQEERERRRQQKESQKNYERLCALQEKEIREKHEREKSAAEKADRNPDQLCVLSEIEPNRFAATLREEIQSALVFAKLLGIAEPIVQGTRARDLLSRTFYEWRRQNSPLYNPLTGKCSQHCYSEGEPTFERAWTFLPGEDYDAELNPSDFEPKPPPESHNGGAAVPVPTAAEQLKSFLEPEAPVALFSSEIAPR
jgi:hypothetical protein